MGPWRKHSPDGVCGEEEDRAPRLTWRRRERPQRFGGGLSGGAEQLQRCTLLASSSHTLGAPPAEVEVLAGGDGEGVVRCLWCAMLWSSEGPGWASLCYFSPAEREGGVEMTRKGVVSVREVTPQLLVWLVPRRPRFKDQGLPCLCTDLRGALRRTPADKVDGGALASAPRVLFCSHCL